MKSIVLAIMLWTSSAGFVQGQIAGASQNTDSVVTATVKVKGITCSSDLKMISTSVEKLQGVISCKAGKHGTTTSFLIKYNPAVIAPKEIFTAIENTGGCENPDERPYRIKQ